MIFANGATALAACAWLALSPAPGHADLARSWPDYPIIIWQDQTPARAAGLRRLGVTAGRVFGTRGALSRDQVARGVAPLRAAGLGCYVENIATDFYAPYHRYHPDHPVTWAFDQIRALHARNPANPAAFRRVPSLSDARALAVVRQRLTEHARLFARYRPLYYSLGDETGIADLAAVWDFDFSPASLAQLRGWLRARFTLAALNRQWGTGFARWDQVVPMTTDAAIHGAGDNFSAWADFKAFMDAAFARAVAAGTAAVHAGDPSALAAIEGAQIPGWGGYDYTRLARAVDVMEIYDSGNSVELARAMNPALLVLTTSAVPSAEAAERGRLWHELLLGGRGLILWDEAGALVEDDGRATALGRSYGALFHEWHDGLAAQLGVARPAPDAVAILYSPASFRIAWLLDRRAEGGDWTARTAEMETQDSPWRAALREAGHGLTHQGLSPRWVTEDMLRSGGFRVLLLPHAIALSGAAVTAIRQFAVTGGTVLADVAPGVLDEHGRRRATPPLAGVARLVAAFPADPPVPPRLRVTQPDGSPDHAIETRISQDGSVTLIGLQRDSGAADAPTVVTLAKPARVYDVRQHRDLGWTARVTAMVSTTEPLILALAPAALPALTISGPAAAQPGAAVSLRIGQSGRLAAARVVRVELRDPSGQPIDAASVTLRDAPARWRIHLPPQAGRWTISASDRLGDATASWTIAVPAGP